MFSQSLFYQCPSDQQKKSLQSGVRRFLQSCQCIEYFGNGGVLSLNSFLEGNFINFLATKIFPWIFSYTIFVEVNNIAHIANVAAFIFAELTQTVKFFKTKSIRQAMNLS